MCGIAGVVSVKPAEAAPLNDMARLFAHRGSDGQGTSVAGNDGFAAYAVYHNRSIGPRTALHIGDRSLVLVGNGEPTITASSSNYCIIQLVQPDEINNFAARSCSRELRCNVVSTNADDLGWYQTTFTRSEVVTVVFSGSMAKRKSPAAK